MPCPDCFSHAPATPAISTLSLHDALPILTTTACPRPYLCAAGCGQGNWSRSEEHTSELQSLRHLVCRLLLEKKIVNVCWTKDSSITRIFAPLLIESSHGMKTRPPAPSTRP